MIGIYVSYILCIVNSPNSLVTTHCTDSNAVENAVTLHGCCTTVQVMYSTVCLLLTLHHRSGSPQALIALLRWQLLAVHCVVAVETTVYERRGSWPSRPKRSGVWLWHAPRSGGPVHQLEG